MAEDIFMMGEVHREGLGALDWLGVNSAEGRL